MSATPTVVSTTSNYQVKSVEPVMVDSDVQARLFILAQTIPWHYHKESGDHYFVLEGALTILTREPEEARTIEAGRDHRIAPGTAHLIANRSAADCRFLLLQGWGSMTGRRRVIDGPERIARAYAIRLRGSIPVKPWKRQCSECRYRARVGVCGETEIDFKNSLQPLKSRADEASGPPVSS